MTQPTNIYRVTPREVRRMSVEIMQARLIPFVKSSPAMGKSSIFRSIADEFALDMIDFRVAGASPEDFNGLPRFADNGTAYFAPFADNFPLKGISEVPKDKAGWLLFLDEANSGTKMVQAAMYKLLLDYQVGKYDLHEDVGIAMAGNLGSDRAIVTEFSTALDSRVITLEMMLDYDEFLEDVAFKQEWDSRVIAYWQFAGKIDALYDFSPKYKDKGEKSFCAPRTWDFLQRMIKDRKVTDENAPMYAGTITSGKAVEFIQFCKVIENIVQLRDVMADPEGCSIPQDSQSRWAVTTHLTKEAKEDNLKSLATYMDRMDIVFRVLFYRGLVARKPSIRSHEEFTKRAVMLSRYLNSGSDMLDDQSAQAARNTGNPS